MSKRLLWVSAAVALSCMPFGCGSDDSGGGSGGGNTGAASGTGGGSSGSGGGGTGGSSGSAGTAGSGGTAGTSGSAGASGSAGTSGSAGASGSAGSGGSSGASGGTGGASGGTGGASGGTGGASGGTGGASGGTGGASGGTGGTGGGTGVSCQQLDAEYKTALAAAKSCTIQPTNQCTTKVDSALGCPCVTYINSANVKAVNLMKAAKAKWGNQGCTPPIVCPKCPVVGGAVCQVGSGSLAPKCSDVGVTTP